MTALPERWGFIANEQCRTIVLYDEHIRHAEMLDILGWLDILSDDPGMLSCGYGAGATTVDARLSAAAQRALVDFMQATRGPE